MSAMETEKRTKECLRLVLVGLQGVGKSAAGNTILGSEGFHSDISSSALTLQTESREGLVCGRPVMVVNTPGLFNSTLSDTEIKEEMEKALTLCHPGPHAFLIIIQLGRFTEQERTVMDELVEMLGSKIHPYSLVLFTYGDKLKNKTIDQFVKEDKNLIKLIGKCGGQYHVFNNNDTENKDQVRKLLEKIDPMIKRRKKQPCYKKSAWAIILCITLEEFVSQNQDLAKLFRMCNQRHHIFNNEVKDPTQVVQLLEKIDKMVSENGGNYYTNEMLQMAERMIEAEKQQILKGNEEQRRRQFEALKQEALSEAYNELQEKQEREAREQAEKNNKYIAIITQVLGTIHENFITKRLENARII